MSSRRAGAARALVASVTLTACSALEPLEVSVGRAADALEQRPPSSAVLRIDRLELSRRVVLPELDEKASFFARVHARGAVLTPGRAVPLVFQGDEQLLFSRKHWWGGFSLVGAGLPVLEAIAAALARRAGGSPGVAAWTVDLPQSARAEVREEYEQDASRRPVAAALLLHGTPDGGGWSFTPSR